MFVLRRGRMPPSTALRDPDASFRQVPEAFALRDALTAALHLDPERRTRRARDFSAALRNAYPPRTTTRARLVVLTEPVAATTPPVLPALDDDGSLRLWDVPPAPRLPELELGGLADAGPVTTSMPASEALEVRVAVEEGLADGATWERRAGPGRTC